MDKKKWTLVNAENVVPYVCEGGYSSKMLTGDEMAGFPVINVNEGTLEPGCRTEGDAHQDDEIYCILEGDGELWLDDEHFPVKPGDIIVIPGGVFHWIDNRQSKIPFKLYTFWPNQSQNGMTDLRMKDWGTCVRNLDEHYTEKRLGK